MSEQPGSESAEAPVAESEVERLNRELAELESRAQGWREDYLRAVAEAENLRKRTQREVEAAHRFAIDRFAADLIEVGDSLELGVAAGAGTDPARLLEGMEATLRLLHRAFERGGVGIIDPAGQAFNPEQHQAMVAQPSEGHPPGTVLSVIQRGYQLNGRLLRPARVIVARAPDPA